MSKIKLYVADTSVRMDVEGRYCLNDLHRAAGEEGKHQPSNFLRLDSTKALIEEIDRSSEVRNALQVIQGGNQQGTYVAKELVYAYAMWISPAFHLKVIRAYDAMASNEVAPRARKADQTEAFKMIPAIVRAAKALGLDKNAAAISANQVVRRITGTNVLEMLGHTHLEAENQESLYFTPTELGERIGVSGRKFNMLLAEAGLQAKNGDAWAPLDAAGGLFRIMDTGKRHGGGAMIQQIKWSGDVVYRVRAA